MKNITLSRLDDPRTYKELMERVFRFASFCSLVVRPGYDFSEAGRAFILKASSALVEEAEVSKWPGTELLGATAKVYRFKTTEEFRTLFKKYGRIQSVWNMPDLPEDPAFFREDGSLLFGSISHEFDAFMELRDDELSIFSEYGENDEVT